MTKRRFNERLKGKVYIIKTMYFKDGEKRWDTKDCELVLKLLAYNVTIAKVCEFNNYEA